MNKSAICDFMNGSLVSWIRTFESDGGRGLTYEALTDGVFLYDVMIHISPAGEVLGCNRALNRCPDDVRGRLSNLTSLLSFVKAFYQDYLGQLVLSSLPDVVKLSRHPDDEHGIDELRQLLLLVLGCAVQSPSKEDVISNIKELPFDTQHGIVQCIQEITDNVDNVWPTEWLQYESIPEEVAPRAIAALIGNCRRLVGERNAYCQDLLKAVLGDEEEGEDDSPDSVHHLGVQLAETKGQLRRLRQDYDEKSELNMELKEELDQVKNSVDKLRQENIELVQDARAARTYRDEADILRERASRVDSLEAEISRYKDKMRDIEFFKTRVEELREDNRILVETKEMLEEQLSSSRRKAEQVLDLENNILQLKQTINHLNTERDMERDHLQEVVEENSQLRFCNKNSISESANLAAQMENLKSRATGPGGRNLGSDIAGDAQTRALKLELENQRLEAELTELRREVLQASSDKFLEIEKENKRLSLKVSHVQESSRNEKTHLLESQQKLQLKEKEVLRLQETISTVKSNSERHTDELEKEVTQLQELLETIRQRQKKNVDDQLFDVERDNKQLTDLNLQLQSQVTRLEYEKQQLSKLAERLRESADKLSAVEHQKTELERENKDLIVAMNTFKESCERHGKLEHDFISLEVEHGKVSRTLENTKETLAKLENSHGEKIQLQVEVERLNRSLASLKLTSTRAADLEMEKEQLLLQNTDLQKRISILQVEKSKAERLEMEIMTSSTEIQKLKRSIENNQKRLADVEKEKLEVENENTKLLRTVETLKLSTRKLNDVERDLTDLEGINDRLDRENRSLKKEVERLKGTLEVKDTLIDESSSKACRVERDHRKLLKEVDTLRSNENRIRILEQERRELDQKTTIERRTLSTLREDLVAEKVKTQQLTNQLESLTSDLSKLGLDASTLAPPTSDTDNDRYKALEGMLEETLKRSVEIREEKISSLESRLTESVARNQQLRNQLLQVKSDYECLLQRQQEEGGDLSLDATKEMSKLKDALRRTNEEKSNLENEVTALSTQTASYREQVCALQSQVTSLSNQNTVISKHNATLQGDGARLQVENTTLQSQSASMIAQNSTLQSSSIQMEVERDKMKKSYEDRGDRLTQLVSDHEALEKLHRQLTQEYEELTAEHHGLRTSHRNLKTEAKMLKDRQTNLSTNENDLLRMKESLGEEMSNLKKDSSSLSNLRAEHSRLKDDFRSLFASNERLRVEYKGLQSDYKAIKTENNTMKLKCTEFSGEINEVRDQLSAMDVEVNKLNNKCQVLQSVNVSLEEDRRSLMSQVSLLLTQYHDLITQTLDDKQHFHQEEKNFTDKLNNLRRQKEKLEEKIMEQYRRMDNSNSAHKKKGFGSNLVKRVRKAGNELMSKVPRTGRSRSRGRDEDDEESQDSSSMGSSLESVSDTRRSTPNLPPSPHDSQDSGEDEKGGTLTPSGKRKAPPLRNSVSSDDAGVEAHREPDVLPVKVAPSTGGELTRAGSRKPLYVNDVPSTDEICGRSSIRSISSHSLNSRNSIVNGSSSPTPGPTSKAPRTSTPLNNVLKEKSLIDDECGPQAPPTTPKLPPRLDQGQKSAPQLPPRGRRGSNQTPDSSISSSQSTSASGTPELRKKAPTSGAPLGVGDVPQKSGPVTKDKTVDNSVWYEYGCV